MKIIPFFITVCIVSKVGGIFSPEIHPPQHTNDSGDRYDETPSVTNLYYDEGIDAFEVALGWSAKSIKFTMSTKTAIAVTHVWMLQKKHKFKEYVVKLAKDGKNIEHYLSGLCDDDWIIAADFIYDNMLKFKEVLQNAIIQNCEGIVVLTDRFGKDHGIDTTKVCNVSPISLFETIKKTGM